MGTLISIVGLESTSFISIQKKYCKEVHILKLEKMIQWCNGTMVMMVGAGLSNSSCIEFAKAWFRYN